MAYGRISDYGRWRSSANGKSRYEPKLNRSEQEVFDELAKDGYTVLRNGWPDFLAFRSDPILGDQVRFIEVKTNGGRVSAVQKRIHKALAAYGITVEIIRKPL